jgi:hypothetical protein
LLRGERPYRVLRVRGQTDRSADLDLEAIDRLAPADLLADLFRDPVGDGREQPVGNPVPVSVIHTLEAVQIDERKRQLTLPLRCVPDRELQTLDEQQPIGQSAQPVVMRHANRGHASSQTSLCRNRSANEHSPAATQREVLNMPESTEPRQLGPYGSEQWDTMDDQDETWNIH